MIDTLTPEARSERMARVEGRNTKPELVVRKLLHAMGYRFRLHAHDLPEFRGEFRGIPGT